MPSVELIAEDALVVRFDHFEVNAASDAVNALQCSLRRYLVNTHPDGIVSSTRQVISNVNGQTIDLTNTVTDLIPAYISLTVIVDFPRVLPQVLQPIIEQLLEEQSSPAAIVQQPKHHTLPCCYNPECAPDLVALAGTCGLTVDEVIHRHSAKVYRVYAIGFSPGFPYMGYVDDTIATPRLATPRSRVAAGAVGIAGNQTGIYPQATPGGWNIIGLCPTPLFFPPENSLTQQAETRQDGSGICRLSTGDSVSFYSISQPEFLALGGRIDS